MYYVIPMLSLFSGVGTGGAPKLQEGGPSPPIINLKQILSLSCSTIQIFKTTPSRGWALILINAIINGVYSYYVISIFFCWSLVIHFKGVYTRGGALGA